MNTDKTTHTDTSCTQIKQLKLTALNQSRHVKRLNNDNSIWQKIEGEGLIRAGVLNMSNMVVLSL